MAEVITQKLPFIIVQAGISGGGSLPSHIDRFFEVCVLQYSLTKLGI